MKWFAKLKQRMDEITPKQIVLAGSIVFILFSIPIIIYAEIIRYRLGHAETIGSGTELRSGRYYIAEIREVLSENHGSVSEPAASGSNSQARPDSMNAGAPGYVYMVRIDESWYYLLGRTGELGALRDRLDGKTVGDFDWEGDASADGDLPGNTYVKTLEEEPARLLVHAEKQKIVEDYAAEHFRKNIGVPAADTVRAGLMLRGVSDTMHELRAIGWGMLSFALGLFMLPLGLMWGFWEKKETGVAEAEVPENGFPSLTEIVEIRKRSGDDRFRIHVIERMILDEEARVTGLKQQLNEYKVRIRTLIFTIFMLAALVVILFLFASDIVLLVLMFAVFSLVFFLRYLVIAAVGYYFETDAEPAVRRAKRRGVNNLSMAILEKEILITRLRVKLEEELKREEEYVEGRQ